GFMKPSWVTKLIRQISVATCWPRASSLIQNELKKAHRIARPVCIASKTNPNNHEIHSCYSKESYDQRCRFDCLGCCYRTAQSHPVGRHHHFWRANRYHHHVSQPAAYSTVPDRYRASLRPARVTPAHGSANDPAATSKPC